MSGEYGSQTFRPSRSARTARIEIFNVGDIVPFYLVAVRKDRED